MRTACARLVWLITTVLISALGGVAAGEATGKALTEGKVSVDLRYRYEKVRDDALPLDAKASTVRLRLGYETGRWIGLSALVEAEALEALGGERYDSTANGRVDRPVVADPEDTEINQLYLQYAGPAKTIARLGRQRITLDNHRFLGNVGWRQNEQTFDALTVRGEPTERLAFFYGRLNNANRVFGEHHPNPALADLALDGDLFRLAYGFAPGTLVGYVYLLELEDTPLASHRNVGVRFSGRHAFSERLALRYAAEAAAQDDYADGASTVDADYRLVEATVEVGRFTAGVGYELLSGDGTYAFATPLATLHAFNGWADKFLVTPASGLEDSYASIGGKVAGLQLSAIYHLFAPDGAGPDYGEEWNLQASRDFAERCSATLKYARYRADGFSSDTSKLFFQVGLRF